MGSEAPNQFGSLPQDADPEVTQPENANRHPEVTAELARESISASFPDFKIDSAEPFAEDTDNVLFSVNRDYVFRFSKSEAADRSLETELAIVPKLRERLSVPIPDFEYTGTQPGSNLHFVGYKKLAGESLTKDTLGDKTGRTNPNIVQRIGTFLNELHRFNTNEAIRSGVEERKFKDFFEKQLREVKERVFPLLRERFPAEASAMTERAEGIFMGYLNDEKNFDYTSKLLHGDLGPENIIVDRQKQDLSGIIDFGGVRVGDPDYDLWRLYSYFGRGFVEELLKYDPHPVRVMRR